MRGLPSGSLPIRYNSRENEIKMRRKKTEKKQFYIGDIFRVIGLIIAFSVLLYPTVSNYLYEKNGSKVISAYDENAVRLSESDKREMLEAARQYNEELLGNIELLDPFSSIKKEVDERYQSLLNVNGSGMIGYIRIPKINAELPIYHGTEEKVLQSGVGHFEGTSLPIGGESTHAVLTGHRGLLLSCCLRIWIIWKKEISSILKFSVKHLPIKWIRYLLCCRKIQRSLRSYREKIMLH